MKIRKILALSMTVATVATASTAALAAEITDVNNSGETTVTANIQDSGKISYVVTIPDKLDFGALTQPETDTDSFIDVKFEVKVTEVNNITDNKYIFVRVKDKNATEDDSLFYLTQKTSPNTKFTYDVYPTGTMDQFAVPLNNPLNKMTDPDGFFLANFQAEGEFLVGTLRFNQKQLYGKDISEIAGDYSGNMVFTTSIVEA